MTQHLNYPGALPASWTTLARTGPLPARPRRRGGVRDVGLWVAVAALALAGSLAAPPVQAQSAELAPALQKLATCEESWYDARRDEARMAPMAEALRAQFRPEDRSPTWKPIGRVTWLGAEVLELTPQSVGMGLGFAVTLKTDHAAVQPAYEQAMGQAMQRCQSSDGTRACELRIAEKRTALIMSPLRQPEMGTMVGCYYFYEK